MNSIYVFRETLLSLKTGDTVATLLNSKKTFQKCWNSKMPALSKAPCQTVQADHNQKLLLQIGTISVSRDR